MLVLYQILAWLGYPLIRWFLFRRKQRGKEDPVRFPERLGYASCARPHGPLVWVHAASVGESLSALPLIDTLLKTFSGSILVTTGTRTSAALMAERLPDGAFHQYVPIDHLGSVQRFLAYWQPDLVLWIESELWPLLLTKTAAYHTPLILINGRLSSRSFKKWQYFPRFIKRILQSFSLCLVQTADDAYRFESLGARAVMVSGNLKFSVPPLPVDENALEQCQQRLAARPCWVAASTHEGEEEIIAAAHALVAAEIPSALTIIVPRHPERGEGIATMLRNQGWNIACRSKQDPLTAETSFYIADTMGELGLFYRLSSVAFIGRSLARGGGQNPLEAARLKTAVVFGPLMENFQAISEKMLAEKAAQIVTDACSLATCVLEMLKNPNSCEAWAQQAYLFAQSEANVLDRVVTKIKPFFPVQERLYESS